MKRGTSLIKVRELYSILSENQFNFVGKGEFHLQEIYSAVKKKYSHLCDDNLICCECCKSSQDHVPEWQHRVRTVLGGLERKKRGIRKGHGRGYWVIVGNK